MSIENINIVLFFTRGVSLQTWDKVGMFEREVALYKCLHQKGINTTFITYGDSTDLNYSRKIPDITICCNKWNLPIKLYEILIPWLHRKHIKNTNLIKTNQTNGALVALYVAKIYRKPFIARCGYMWSKNTIIENGISSSLSQRALKVERKVFTSADLIVVTTNDMKNDLKNRFPNISKKINVIPNYVDTSRFYPYSGNRRENKLCFIGRLSPEKNIESLLDAIEGIGVSLVIIGEGLLRTELEDIAKRKNINVKFLGRVQNEELPEYLNQASIFVFPSLYEGHPKTPIEAMSCGTPVVATRVSGNVEIIKDGVTGLLCDTDKDSIRHSILKLLGNEKLRRKMSKCARQYVEENYSINKVIIDEIRIYKKCLNYIL